MEGNRELKRSVKKKRREQVGGKLSPAEQCEGCVVRNGNAHRLWYNVGSDRWKSGGFSVLSTFTLKLQDLYE